MQKIITLLISLFITSSLMAETGILILAHGSMSGNGGGHGHHHEMVCHNHNPSEWEKAVLDAVTRIKSQLPHKSEVAFGMWDTNCFDAGIERLQKQFHAEDKTLDHLIVFPLFVSSYSAVIEMQKFIFKKRQDRAIPIPSVRQTFFNGKITYMKALDYDPQISFILANRFHHLVHLAKEAGFQKKEMELVLVMHGPVADQDNLHWLKMGQRYLDDIMYLFPVFQGHIISLRDDASSDVRNQATKELQGIVANAHAEGKIALVLPLLLSKSGIEKGILERLKGHTYIWSGEMILPDTKLEALMLDRLE